MNALNQYSDNEDDDEDEDPHDYKLDNCDAKDIEDPRKDQLLNSESKSCFSCDFLANTFDFVSYISVYISGTTCMLHLFVLLVQLLKRL